MAGYLYPLFPIVSALGFVLALIPLPWHLEAWNSGTCYYMIWAALGCLNSFINSVVWANDAIDRAPIWCDICTCQPLQQVSATIQHSTIATRITLGVSVGIPAASMCIMRRLYNISNIQAVATSRVEVCSVYLTKLGQRSDRATETPCNFNRFSHLRPASSRSHGPR